MTGLVEEIYEAMWRADGLDSGEEVAFPKARGLENEARAALSVILKRLENPTPEMIKAVRDYKLEQIDSILSAEHVVKRVARHLASEGEGE